MQKQSEKAVDLGTFLDEVKLHCKEQAVAELVAEVMEFEKEYSHSYKDRILAMLTKYTRNSK